MYLLDIAVGAPYEEGTGVVYIYNGKTPRMEDKYSQRIFGKDIRVGVSGFGYYISKFGEDLDENKYNGNLKKKWFYMFKINYFHTHFTLNVVFFFSIDVIWYHF